MEKQQSSCIQAEVVEFLKGEKFACSPFKRILYQAGDPQSFVSVLQNNGVLDARIIRSPMRSLKTGLKKAHVFVHPVKIKSEDENRALAATLNLEAALELSIHYGYGDDFSLIRATFLSWINNLSVTRGGCDLVKEVSRVRGAVSDLFATYMSPHLPVDDTRYAPYPLMAIVRTDAVSEVSEETKKRIISNAIDRNGDRGFNGSYFPERGLRSKESLS